MWGGSIIFSGKGNKFLTLKGVGTSPNQFQDYAVKEYHKNGGREKINQLFFKINLKNIICETPQ